MRVLVVIVTMTNNNMRALTLCMYCTKKSLIQFCLRLALMSKSTCLILEGSPRAY